MLYRHLLLLLFATSQACSVAPAQDERTVGVMDDQGSHSRASELHVSPQNEVVFSPQTYTESHLPRIVRAIDAAERSVDAALYSFRDNAILEAMARAVLRGVRVRVLFEGANSDRTRPEGSMSAQLEDAGVDVRYVNKILHHKFALLDGVQALSDDPSETTLISGSGNWSYSAATRYDENTLFLRDVPELALAFQAEFNRLWNNSRDFHYRDFAFFTSASLPSSIHVDTPDVEARFTSANFRTYESTRYGPTFSVIRGRNEISDFLVEHILNAEHSIRIASGHLRSRPVAEALIKAHTERPGLDIRVYLDGQEWISEWAEQRQEADFDRCIAKAGTSQAKKARCLDVGYYFGYELHKAGIRVRYKYYAYNWHYSFAQMHHKYLLIDDAIITGSYNLSDNAEHNTMENVIYLDGTSYPDLHAAFDNNFEAMWSSPRKDYDALMARIEDHHSATPLIFEPLSLDWNDIDRLRREVRDACPDVYSDMYRASPPDYPDCEARDPQPRQAPPEGPTSA